MSSEQIVQNCGHIGLFCGHIGLLCAHIGLFCGHIELVCGHVGLFCRHIGLFYYWEGVPAATRRVVARRIGATNAGTPSKVAATDVTETGPTPLNQRPPRTSSPVLQRVLQYERRYATPSTVAVCCGVLQCVAVCCSVLQCVAVCCSVLPCVAVHCSVLPCVAVCCSVLQCV